MRDRTRAKDAREAKRQHELVDRDDGRRMRLRRAARRLARQLATQPHDGNGLIDDDLDPLEHALADPA